MKEISDGRVKYAYKAKDAGLDVCEIYGSQGFLPQQFWSPWVNHLTDSRRELLLFITEV